MAEKGEVESLVIDGGTYLVGLLWDKINQLEESRSANTGNIDGQAMYRSLGIQLQRLFASSILTMATRAHLNLVVSFHLKRESDETIQGGKNRARKLTLDSDLAIAIEGGFRNKIEGLFGGSLYLERKLVKVEIPGTNPPKTRSAISYTALCDLTTGFNTVVTAKTRYGLPPRLDLNKQTLYEALESAMGRKAETTAK
jgi:hypothetical protein